MSVNLADELAENPYSPPRETGVHVRNYLTLLEELLYPGGIVYSEYLYDQYLSETPEGASFNSTFWKALPSCVLMEGAKLCLGVICATGVYYSFN